MNPLEKALIALRGAFQYANKQNIHVDNIHSIDLINKTLDEYRKEEANKRKEKLEIYTALINLIRLGYFKDVNERELIDKMYNNLSKELFPKGKGDVSK